MNPVILIILTLSVIGVVAAIGYIGENTAKRWPVSHPIFMLLFMAGTASWSGWMLFGDEPNWTDVLFWSLVLCLLSAFITWLLSHRGRRPLKNRLPHH